MNREKNKHRWQLAQEQEYQFWQGVVHSEDNILRIMNRNEERANFVHDLATSCSHVLEIGVGPLGVGVVGFLQGDTRIGLDPLPLLRSTVSQVVPEHVRKVVEEKSGGVCYIVGSGEYLPFREEIFDMVVCCNVLDHVADPFLVLRESNRVLKPGGVIFVEVDVFSVLGLLKWNLWTKIIKKRSLLVIGHPHRFLARHIVALLNRSGFVVESEDTYDLLSLLAGKSRPARFLARKQTGASV